MTLIIGEIGVNHNGDLQIAKEMIEVAKKIGLNAVKIQSFKTDKLVNKSAEMASYQVAKTKKQTSQFEMLKKYELSFKEQKELFDYARLLNIKMISTPFDEDSLYELIELDIDIIKIGSGDITNIPLLQEVNKCKKDIILSTGMSNLSEVEEALEQLRDCDVTLLHCTSNYPASFESVNLKAMNTLKYAFNKKIGYSDHTLGNLASCLAVGLGAEVIEKHFTLDKNMEGPDHKASLDPNEMKNFINEINNVSLLLGDGIKRMHTDEVSTANVARKSITVNKQLKKGSTLIKEDLIIRRPGSGISPKYLDYVVGKKINKVKNDGETLDWEDLFYEDK